MILNKEQETLIELIKKLAAFFDENEIKYYLLGGSAIGGLRHKGFIPWDNDIDIIMDHENYYKMISLADSLPWEDIKMVCPETSEIYYRPYVQFYSTKDTCFLHSGMFNQGEAMGTLIDVMCMDDIPSDRLADYQRSFILYQELLNDVFTYNPRIVDYEEEYLSLCKERQSIGKAAVLNKLKAEFEALASEDCDQCVVRFWGRRIRNYQKEWFSKPRYVQFEDMMLPVAEKAEACLRLQYGYDWYRLPESEDQEVHGFILNHEISYNNYCDELSEFIEWEETRQMLNKRKMAGVENLCRRRPVDITRNTIGIRRLFAKLKLNENMEKLEETFDKGAYREFNENFENIIKNLKLFDILDYKLSDIELHAVEMLVESLIYDGRFYDGEKLARMIFKKWSHLALDSKAFAILNQVLELVCAYQDSEYDLLKERFLAFDQVIGTKVPEYIRAAYTLSQKKLIDMSDTSIMNMCQTYLEQSPDNYDIIKIKADIIAAQGNEEKAKELHQLVFKNSRNGLDVLELEERYGFKSRYIS